MGTLKSKLYLKLVSRVGIEPTTPGLRGPCSNHLSYRPIMGVEKLSDFDYTTITRKNK